MREKIVLGVVSFIALVSVILTVLLFNVTQCVYIAKRLRSKLMMNFLRIQDIM